MKGEKTSIIGAVVAGGLASASLCVKIEPIAPSEA